MTCMLRLMRQTKKKYTLLPWGELPKNKKKIKGWNIWTFLRSYSVTCCLKEKIVQQRFESECASLMANRSLKLIFYCRSAQSLAGAKAMYYWKIITEFFMLRKQNLNLNGVRFVGKLNAYMYEREKRIFIIC